MVIRITVESVSLIHTGFVFSVISPCHRVSTEPWGTPSNDALGFGSAPNPILTLHCDLQRNLRHLGVRIYLELGFGFYM